MLNNKLTVLALTLSVITLAAVSALLSVNKSRVLGLTALTISGSPPYPTSTPRPTFPPYPTPTPNTYRSVPCTSVQYAYNTYCTRPIALPSGSTSTTSLLCNNISGLIRSYCAPTPTLAPTCALCGGSCVQTYPGMACPTGPIPYGLICVNVGGRCTFRPNITPTSTRAPTPRVPTSTAAPTVYHYITPTLTRTPTIASTCVWCNGICTFRTSATSCTIPYPTPANTYCVYSVGSCVTIHSDPPPYTSPTSTTQPTRLPTTTITPTLPPIAASYPQCGWCGASCVNLKDYVGMACVDLAPPSGARCYNIGGTCQMVFIGPSSPPVAY